MSCSIGGKPAEAAGSENGLCGNYRRRAVRLKVKVSMTRELFKYAAAALLFAIGMVGAVRGEIIEQILVKVNGEIFTKSQLEVRQVAAIRERDRERDPNLPVTDAELHQMLEEVTPELIVSIVDEMLIVQHGKELGYSLSDEQFESVLENIKKENNFESDEAFQAALEQEKISLAVLRANVERQMVVSRVQQNEVAGRIAVSEEEARRYYESHLTEFTTPRGVTLREVFVKAPSDGTSINVAVDEAARARAAALRDRALAGESVETLASDFSESPSKANGGRVGPLSFPDLSDELRGLLESMQEGGVSELLRTPLGYQFLKLESLTPAQAAPFEEAREEISDRIFADKRQREFLTFLDRLRSEAIIDWKLDELKVAYDRGLEQRIAAAGTLL